jgi:hypothetical protein
MQSSPEKYEYTKTEGTWLWQDVELVADSILAATIVSIFLHTP